MKSVPVETTTVNVATGEVEKVEIKRFGLLPPAPDKCQQCATAHESDMPHNAQSLFYQYAFYGEHERWPNWLDAMAHCSEEMKALWIAALSEKGVDVAGGGVNPRSPREAKGE